jgi:hypothetical protein
MLKDAKFPSNLSHSPQKAKKISSILFSKKSFFSESKFQKSEFLTDLSQMI